MGAAQVEIVPLRGGDAEAHGSAVAEWVLDAGNPYAEWLCLDDRAHALRYVRAALTSERSELWIGHVTALMEGGETVGGYLALPGSEVVDRRRADLVDLIRLTPSEKRAELRTRVGHGKDIYVPIDPHHRYLSRIGVLQPYRGRGLGGRLLDAFIASSRHAGYTGVRLDVNRANGHAVRLYEAHGFTPAGARTLDPLGVEYLAMTRSLH